MKSEYGRITLLCAIVLGGGVMLFFSFGPVHILTSGISHIFADTATTTVTVLNTPPQWTVDAQEAPESSTSTPTNAGSPVSWSGTATDSNNDPYYLLICKTTSTPIAHSASAPTCAGGAGSQWTVSSLTTSSIQATASYTTTSTDDEANVWVGWICDGNASNPSCNGTFKQGTAPTDSPFVVNHRPTFAVFTDNSPAIPGAVVTWSSTASDTDVFGGADTVSLFVCKANDFTGSACGPAGSYCTSSSTASNPSCNTTLSVPLQDQNYTSFGFVTDNHSFPALGGAEATDSVLTVSNVAPSITSSSISLLNTNGAGNLTLTVPGGQTTGFQVKFTVRDNNSCLNASGGNEIIVSSTVLSVYRSGVGQSSCQAGGNYNPNSCYPSAVGTTTWNYTCVQDAGSCTSSSSPTATFTCTFPLQYLADATDGVNATDTQFFAQNWLSSVKATDDNAATSSFVEASIGNELSSFLAYTLNTPAISFGGLSPGQFTNPLVPTTTVTTNGNVGLDTTLFGTDMCTTYPSCSVSTTSTVPV